MNYTLKNPVDMGIYVQTGNIKTIAQVKDAIGADTICNFQMFTIATREANYVLRADGKLIGWDGCNYWGIGWNKGDKTFTYDYAQNMEKYDNFAGCVPILRDGKIVQHVPGETYPTAIGGRRGHTVIGTKADGSIVIHCWPDGSKEACRIEDIGQKMLDLGCVNAINFDGGGSTQLICPDGKVTTPRAIYNFLWFKEDKPENPTEDCPYPEPKRNVRYGNKGEDVKWVQWQLKRHGFDIGKFGPNKDGIDGEFGGICHVALVDFQRKVFPNKPAEWDGIAGEKTVNKLKGG